MPLATLPAPTVPTPGAAPRAGVLPFLYSAEVRDATGELLAAAVPCMIWPAGATASGRAGRNHTHTGEAHPAYAAAFLGPNRRLVIEAGQAAGEYMVVNAITQPFVPHVQLELTSRAA